MPPNVKDVDRGYKAFQRNMVRFIRKPNVTVGIQATEAAQTRGFGETNVTIAAVHEFGSRDGRIPQRSFIRASVDRERALLNRMLDTAVRRIAESGDARRHLGLVGERARAEMVRTIDNSIGLAPLTPAGIRSKVRPSTTPLLDTGQLKGAITWKAHNV